MYKVFNAIITVSEDDVRSIKAFTVDTLKVKLRETVPLVRAVKIEITTSLIKTETFTEVMIDEINDIVDNLQTLKGN